VKKGAALRSYQRRVIGDQERAHKKLKLAKETRLGELNL